MTKFLLQIKTNPYSVRSIAVLFIKGIFMDKSKIYWAKKSQYPNCSLILAKKITGAKTKYLIITRSILNLSDANKKIK